VLGCPSKPAEGPELPIAPSPTTTAAVAPPPEPAAPPAYVEPGTKLPFPVSLGDTRFAGHRQYDPPELGVSVRYELGLEGHMDIYVYDKGLPAIGAGATAPDIVAEVASAIEDVGAMVANGTYRDAKVQSQTVRDFGGTSFQEARLVVVASTTLDSWIYLTGYRGHFVKVRTSYAASQAAQARPLVDEMMTALGRLIADQGAAAPGA
jgi:hypothetical protein